MTTTVQGIAGLREKVGEHLGYSDYARDHPGAGRTCSPTRPVTTSGSTSTPSGPRTAPSAAPIAHGYLTLSLGPMLCAADRAGRGRHDGRQLRLRQGALPVAGAGRLQAPPRRRAGRGRRHRRRQAQVTYAATPSRSRARPSPPASPRSSSASTSSRPASPVSGTRA